MSRLAATNRVVYFEPFHGLMSPKRSAGVQGLREVRDGLWVYRPTYPYLPGNMRSAAARLANGSMYRREIAALLGRMGIAKPWLWAYFAQNLSVLDLPFKNLIYDCVDDWPSFFPNPAEKRFVRRTDEQLCRRAGMVFVGSEPLLEKRKTFNDRTFVVNHAADISHFMSAADPALAIPSDLEAVPHPRIGFVGMVDELRFDVGLIAKLAENPENQIVIVGGFMGDARKRVPERPNVHVLGMKPVAALPAYLKGMDALIMPYTMSETTRYIFPLKLFEYLATGKPVVATPISAVLTVRDYFYVADSPGEFAGLVRLALEERDAAAQERRREKARAHTWEAHVQRKLDLMAEHLLELNATGGR